MADYTPQKLQHYISVNTDKSLTIKTAQDVGGILDRIAEERANDERRGRQLLVSAARHKIATIPLVVVQLWKDEGYDLFSPERSGMTPEQHKAELARRLTGGWARLNTSRFKKL